MTGRVCNLTSWSAVVVLTLLAIGLRTVGLNAPLWCDEIVTVVNSIRVPTFTLLTSYFWDNQHTLYSLLAQATVTLFGESPWAIRLPAMILGALSIPALYLLGCAVTSRFEAFAAAALLTVSYHQVWFSQNARGYTALLFATLLATWCLWQALHHPRWWTWPLYAFVVALGTYTHLTMVFLAVSHALVCAGLILRKRLPWRPPVIGFLLAAGLTVLLYAPMLPQIYQFFFQRSSPLKGVSTPLWALAEAVSSLKAGFGGALGVGQLVLLLGGMVVLLGAWSYFRQNRLALALFVLPVLLTVAGALLMRGTMYPRFFFYLMGFAILIAVRGLVVLSLAMASWLWSAETAERRGYTLAGIGLTFLVVVSAASLSPNYLYAKQDFQGALAYLEAHRMPSEPVLTAGVPASFCYQRYYQRDWERVTEPDQLTALRGAGERVWLVYAFPRYLDKENPALLREIQQGFVVAKVFPGTLSGGDVIVCLAQPLEPSKGGTR